MPDNPPESENTAPDADPVETQKSSSDRPSVPLSSVAKAPPPLPVGGTRPVAPPKHVGPLDTPGRGTILPTRDTPSGPPVASQLSRTMEVILPPKTGVLPKIGTFSGPSIIPPAITTPAPVEAKKADAPAEARASTPPPLPVVTPAPEHDSVKRLAPFKLKAIPLSDSKQEDSIFSEPDSVQVEEKPKGWKHLEPGELPPLRAEPAAPVEPEKSAAPATPEPEAPAPAAVVAPLEPPKTVPPLVGAGAPTPSGKLRLPPAIKKSEPTVSKAPALTQPSSTPTLPPPLPVVASVTKVPVSALRTAALPPPLPVAKEVVPPAIGDAPVAIEAKSPEKSPTPPPIPDRSTPPVEAKSNVPALPGSASAVIPAVTAVGVYGAIVAKDGTTSLPRLRAPALPRASKPPEDFKPLPAEVAEPSPPKDPAAPVEAAPAPEPIVIAPPIKEIAPANPPLISRDKSTGQVTEPPPPVPRGRRGRPAPVAKAPAPKAVEPKKEEEEKLPLTRSERTKRRQLIGTIVFYAILVLVLGPLLYFLTLHYSSETRVEGQVIPPQGTLLNNEVWIVSDFRGSEAGVAEDLALARAPKLQEIQERQDHVQRAQADIAAREQRIHLLQDQIQAAKDEINSVVKQAHDAAQHVWDGPGADLENEYQSKLTGLQQAIAARAKSLGLNYQPDPTYQSPEVWANAYRLALYQTPPGVDGVKEHQWIEDQLKAWRDYTKSFDDQKEKLRLQATQIQLSPTQQVSDLNDKIEDLQHRVDSTESEEEPLKAELQQAQSDLAESQTAEAGLDDKYYQELYSLPKNSIIKRLPMLENGRFTWSHLEKDSAFAEGEKVHNYWIFARAVRSDGRQYWALARFPIGPNSILPLFIQPDSFISTKAILRPDLSPDEQAQ